MKMRNPYLRSGVGSFFSANAGLFAGLMFGYSWLSLLYGGPAFWLHELPEFLFEAGLPAAVLILPIWALVLWPLYHRLPSDSRFWRVPRSTLCFAAIGAVYAILIGQEFGWWWFGTICGGVTGLCASLSKQYFRAGNRDSLPASPEQRVNETNP